MSNTLSKKIFVLYIPGMDLRNLSAGNTPFLHQAFRDYSWSRIETLPSPEQLSTVLTGMYPHDHGIWQMKLLGNAGAARNGRAYLEKLPDFLTTTFQCVRHQLCRNCDVPTLPPARRREFEMHRLKFHGRRHTRDLLRQLGDVPSVVSHLGTRDCKYSFSDRLEDFDTAVNNSANGEPRLEIAHLHALDMMGHWVLDTPEKLGAVYRHADAAVQALADKCRSRGITMFAVTDHGQEHITGTINIRRKLRELDLDTAEYSYYLQPITARFWFHTERAREKITELLGKTAHGTALCFGDLRQFGIDFRLPDYGEVYFIADPGYLFFPHDFHHPLVNLVFGLKDRQQRRRLRDPRHLAYHGYLPHHESEKGWIVGFDERLHFQEQAIKLVDIMPSLLSVLGEQKPGFMTGRNRL